MRLVTFATGKPKGKATRQIVALWTDAHSSKSRLVSYDATGQPLASHDYDGQLKSMMIYRPTNQYDPRVVAAGKNEVVLFHKLKPSWAYPLKSPLQKLEILDCNGDRKKDLAVTAATGKVCLTVEGTALTLVGV